jgi:hypothetical protein
MRGLFLAGLTILMLAGAVPLAADASEPVFVNCQHTLRGASLRSVLTARQHPTSCNVWGEPEDLADLFELRQAHWNGWGERTASVSGRVLNTHPGMGGPASSPVNARLYRIRRGCLGLLFYTRVSFPHSNARTLVLSAACKP